MALAKGLKRYFTGKPCKQGHIAPRYVNGHACTVCAGLRQEANPDSRASVRRWMSRHPQASAASVACMRARKIGMPFDKKYLISLPCPDVCPILGTRIVFERGKGQRPSENTASFDQIVPGRGYIEGNVRIMSRLANSMLNSATPDQRVTLARWILNEYRPKLVEAA